MHQPSAETAPGNGIRIRLFFWLAFSGAASFIPFLGLYYDSVFSRAGNGHAIELVTLLLVLQPLLSILSNPFVGYLADRFRIKDRLLLICSLATAAGGLLVGLPGLGLAAGLSADAALALMGSGIVVIGLCAGPVFPIINSETFDHLHARGEGGGAYGRYRVHGSFSWILFTALMGVALTLTRWLPLVTVVYGAGYFLLALTAAAGVKSGLKPVRLPFTLLRRDRRFRRFIVFNMLQSFSLFASLYFTGYYLNEAKVDYLFIGLAFAAGAVAEIPLMLNAGRLTARFGNRLLVAAGTAVLAAKLLFLGLAVAFRQTWLVIPIMSIHGLGFGLQLIGVMNLLDEMAHRDLRTVYLNLYTVIGVNIPTALGLVFSGWLIRAVGGTLMMIINSGCTMLAIVYFLIFMKPKPASESP